MLSNPTLKHFVKKMAAISFCSLPFVRTTWLAVQQEALQIPHVDELVLYFDSTWILRSNCEETSYIPFCYNFNIVCHSLCYFDLDNSDNSVAPKNLWVDHLGWSRENWSRKSWFVRVDFKRVDFKRVDLDRLNCTNRLCLHKSCTSTVCRQIRVVLDR